MGRFFLFVLVCCFQVAVAQQITCSPKDAKAFSTKVSEIHTLKKSDNFGEYLVNIGKTFLDVPYVAKTLEIGEAESLVVNLQGLDCTTFVENVLAFGLVFKADSTDFYSFTNTLKKIRYRDAKLDGYASRLHYFTDWIANNEEKGLVKNITQDIGGKSMQKEINFMGTHRNLYPFLKNDTNFEKILQTEAELAKKELCILAQDQIEGQEHLIQSGDIIAMATSIKGLDVTHTGIAIQHNKRIHLLHASTGSMKVEISKLPLAEYIKKIKNNTGIIVVRPNN